LSIRIFSIRVSSADRESVEDGRVIRSAAGDDVVAVLIVVLEIRTIVAIQVSAEDRLVEKVGAVFECVLGDLTP